MTLHTTQTLPTCTTLSVSTSLITSLYSTAAAMCVPQGENTGGSEHRYDSLKSMVYRGVGEEIWWSKERGGRVVGSLYMSGFDVEVIASGC